jgi:hypothetical protein
MPHGNLRTLIDKLHELHRRAGCPSTRAMSRDQDFSYTTVHELFTKATGRAPSPIVLLAVVEMLAKTARRVDVEKTLDEFDRMRQAADEAPFHDYGASPEAEELQKMAAAVVTEALSNVDREPVFTGFALSGSPRSVPPLGPTWSVLRITLPTDRCSPQRINQQFLLDVGRVKFGNMAEVPQRLWPIRVRVVAPDT